MHFFLGRGMVLLASMGLALSLGAGGCGSTVTTESGANGSGASGATGTGAGTTTVASSNGGGGAGGCASFHDESSSDSVTVRFINESGQDIYMPASCGTLLYDLQSNAEEDGLSYIYDPSCLQTCEDLQTMDVFQCEQCAPSSYRIPAGGMLETVWDGSGLRWVEMPDSCWLDSSFGPGCRRREAASPGGYWIDARGFSECEAFDGPCACDASGYCEGTAIGEEAIADFTELSFPEQSLIEVVFGVCAFPCP